MNKRAKAFANMLKRLADDGHTDGDTLQIYQDGLILHVEGSADRHLTIRDYLKQHHPDFEEARAGRWSVFLVPMDTGTTPPLMLPPIFIAAARAGYTDHRQDNYGTLEAVLSLVDQDIP